VSAGVDTVAIFVSCALALVTAEVASRVRPGTVADLTTVFQRLLARRATRVAVMLAWGWIGWHFLVTPPK
jgi:hypothetical protein